MSWPWILVLATVSAVVVVQSVLLIGLLTRLAPALEHFTLEHDGPPQLLIGALLPPLPLLAADGTVTTLHEIRRPSVLLIVSPHCGHCDRLLNALDEPIPGLTVLTESGPAGESQTTHLPAWLPIYFYNDTLPRTLNIATTPLAIAIDHERRTTAAITPTGTPVLRELAALQRLSLDITPVS
ncbi:hypothetical protein [Nocardia blacklockiae]|uniref:hypothetical protein n=1 Tax=Nocardia blacklockiae TaxID=480036 RepID=UPI001894EA6D|nr:hypothetical protein [Nocardia blacklockiae]MBF6175036.1 hypothetical protein [Nocardia blacklockiae]